MSAATQNEGDAGAPVTVFASYRVQQEQEDAFLELLRTHHPTLVELSLATDRPPALFRSRDAQGRVTIHEHFDWVDEGAPSIAHEHPDVAAIWERMGALLEARGDVEKWGFRHAERLSP